MADKVKLSKDGNAIDFVQSESIPTSVKKFRQSPEIQGFYRFIYENDLQKEAYSILEKIVGARKLKKKSDKAEANAAAAPVKKVEAAPAPKKAVAPIIIKKAIAAPVKTVAPAKAAAPAKKMAPVKAVAKKIAPPAKKKAVKKK